MSFPTSSVLDDFTRADAANLGSNWSTRPIFPGDSTIELNDDSATIVSPESPGGESIWLPNGFSGSIEVWCKASGIAGDPTLFACMSGEDTGNVYGYKLEALASSTNSVHLTVLYGSYGVGQQTDYDLPKDFGGFGMSIAGGTITAYAYDSGTDTWSSLGTWTDDTYNSGDIGLGFQDYGTLPDGITAFGGGGTIGASTFGSVPPTTPTGTAGGRLVCQATDLLGNAIGSPGHPLPLRTDGGAPPSVTIPLSDSRTGTLCVSMYENIAGALEVANTAVKVWYYDPAAGTRTLVLWGHVLSKSDDFDAGTTTVQLHDATIRLKKRYFGYNHYSIYLTYDEAIPSGSDSSFVNSVTGGDFEGISSAYGVPLDGTGLRLMMLDTSHGASDWPGGGFDSVPAMGIRYGVDNANRQPVYGAGGAGSGVPFNGITKITGTLTEGNDTITDVDFSTAQATNAAGTAITPTIDNVPLYGALVVTSGEGTGIPQFSIVSSASGTSIVMSEEATVTGSVTFTVEAAIYCQLARGDCVYDDWTDMVQSQGAFECDFIPIDQNTLGPSGATWEPGQMCELYTANRVGTDRSVEGNAPQGPGTNVPVLFTHGIGGFHLTHGPDADYLITYCIAPWMRVLTDDLRWVRADSVAIGDGLLAFDEHDDRIRDAKYDRGGRSRKWRDAVVTGARSVVLPSVRIDTDGGPLTCSEDHLWLVQNKRSHRKWRRARDLRIGDRIVKPLSTWDSEDSFDAGWLSGIFDGEGSVGSVNGRTFGIGFTQRRGLILDRALEILKRDGWLYSVDAHGSPDCVTVNIRGGLAQVLGFLGRYRPIRLLDRFDASGRMFSAPEYATVTGVQVIGEQPMIALGTTTATFVCEGLASHNCVEAGPGGPEGVDDLMNKVTQEATYAVDNYGIWEAWEQAMSAGTGDNEITNAVLANRANAVLTAYQNPPQFCTATIDTDVVGHAVYGRDYFIGDTVTIFARKGSVTVGPLAVRITEVDLNVQDEDGNTQVALTMVPYLTASPGLEGGEL